MQLAELILVIVMIGRTQDRAAQAALSDKSVLALRRLSGRAFRLVKSAKVPFENVGHSLVLGKP